MHLRNFLTGSPKSGAGHMLLDVPPPTLARGEKLRFRPAWESRNISEVQGKKSGFSPAKALQPAEITGHQEYPDRNILIPARQKGKKTPSPACQDPATCLQAEEQEGEERGMMISPPQDTTCSTTGQESSARASAKSGLDSRHSAYSAKSLWKILLYVLGCVGLLWAVVLGGCKGTGSASKQ